MNESSRRTFLRAGIGTLAVFGGCAGRQRSSGKTTKQTSSTTDESTTAKPDPVSNEAIRWHAPGGRLAVSDGIVYSGGDAMRAFDAESGERRWEFALDDPIRSAVTVGPKGIAFTTGKQGAVMYHDAAVHCLSTDGNERFRYPQESDASYPLPLAMDSEAVYVGFSDDYWQPTGHKTCAVSSDGTERWAANTGDARAGRLHDDLLLVPTPRRLYALDRKTGENRWTVDTDYSGVNHVSSDTVFVGKGVKDEDALIAVNATNGTERWRFSGDHTVNAGYEAGTVYAVAGEYKGDHEFSALDAKTGDEKWTQSFESSILGVESTPSTAVVRTGNGTRIFASDGSRLWQTDVSGALTATEETLYVSTGEKLSAFDATTGTKRFEFDGTDTSPSYVGDVLLLSGGKKTSLTALTPDGNELWRFETGARLGRPVVTDDSVFVSGGDGYLYALDIHS